MNPITQDSLQFLGELSINNDRDWFNANKSRYEKVLKEPFKKLVGSLLEALQADDPSLPLDAGKCIFRLHRDTRFSKDKQPYKNHVGANISPGGLADKSYPGFYLQIGVDSIWMGGGAYFLERPDLLKVRTYLAQNPAALTSVIEEATFKQAFGSLQGEKQKRLAPELQAAAALQPILYQTQFYYMATYPTEMALDPDYLGMLVKHYYAGRPVTKLLIDAMSSED
jgi:uncharacterized protein (TIGR02453 family)